MAIYFFMGMVFVLFVITWVIIAINSPDEKPTPDLLDPDKFRSKPFSEVMLEAKVSHLELANAELNSKCKYIEQRLYEARYRNHCDHMCCVHPAQPNNEKVVNLFKEVCKPLDQIKKELGVK